jgi:hypothetical protein
MRTSAEWQEAAVWFGALMGFRDELKDRADKYARQNGLALGDELGAGVHAIFLLTQSQP